MGIQMQGLIQLLFVVLIALTPAVAMAAEFEGNVSASIDGDGKVESAEFTFWNGKEKSQTNVVLDKAGQKLAKEAGGKEVEVSGSIITKKKEKWFKVKSFAFIFTGSLTVERDAKKKITALKMASDGGAGELPVVQDGGVVKAVEKAEGQKFRIIGSMVQKNKIQHIKVKTIAEIRTFRGEIKTVIDKKGKLRSSKLTVTDGKKKTVYGIYLDGKGQDFASSNVSGGVVITGILKGKLIRVLESR